MRRTTLSARFTLLLVTLLPWSAVSSQTPTVREFDQNGIRYRETRTMVQQPVRDVQYIDQPQIAYQPYVTTEVQNLVQERLIPTTSYQVVPRVYDWWRVFGVFGEPYVVHGLEPTTHWQRQPVGFAAPTTRQVIVPYSRTVKVAVPYLRFEQKELVATVPIGPAAATQIATAPTSSVPLNPPPSYVAPSIPHNVVATLPPTTAMPSMLPPPTYIPADPYVTNPFPQTFVPVPPPTWTAAGSTTSPTVNNAVNGMTFSTRAPLGGSSIDFRPAAAAGVGTMGNPVYGGVARLTGDPPRYGVSTSGAPLR